MGLSIAAEAMLLLIFGVILYPDGSVVHKIVWTIGFGGVGMSATTGALVDVLVVGRWAGAKAVMLSAIIGTTALTACDLLCLSLDHHFNYCGGSSNPELLFWSGIVASLIGSTAAGLLLFTEEGSALLSRLGL